MGVLQGATIVGELKQTQQHHPVCLVTQCIDSFNDWNGLKSESGWPSMFTHTRNLTLVSSGSQCTYTHRTKKSKHMYVCYIQA